MLLLRKDGATNFARHYPRGNSFLRQHVFADVIASYDCLINYSDGVIMLSSQISIGTKTVCHRPTAVESKL